jgi:hypothetical protein
LDIPGASLNITSTNKERNVKEYKVRVIFRLTPREVIESMEPNCGSPFFRKKHSLVNICTFPEPVYQSLDHKVYNLVVHSRKMLM